MTDSPSCQKCQKQMTKIGTLDSGNSKYLTYRCGACHSEKTVCVGIGK